MQSMCINEDWEKADEEGECLDIANERQYDHAKNKNGDIHIYMVPKIANSISNKTAQD
jgi:hypothetical protein